MYSGHLPLSQPQTAKHIIKEEDTVHELQAIKKCKGLDDTLSAVADLASEAQQEVEDVHRILSVSEEPAEMILDGVLIPGGRM